MVKDLSDIRQAVLTGHSINWIKMKGLEEEKRVGNYSQMQKDTH